MYKEISYYNNDGERVYNKAFSFTGRFSEKNGYSLYAHGKTINTRTTVKFPEAMNKVDIANMLLLSQRLLPSVNVLGHRTNKGNVPMKVKQMGNIIGTKDRQTQRFVNKMIDLNMMKRVTIHTVDGDKEIRHIVNPLFFSNGKTISDELYWLFNEQLNEVLPKWVQDEYTKRRDAL